jgi:hypothetical protein
MTYALHRSGLSADEIEAPESWSAAPNEFLQAFRFTAHLLNIFALLSVIFSLLRGGKEE